MKPLAHPIRNERDWEALAVEVFSELRELGFDGVGITRQAFAEGETAAMGVMERLAAREGLVASRDAGDNLVVSLPDEAPGPYILVGSHLDSVPRGGNFDGAAGVLAGLMVLARMKSEGIAPPRPVRVIGLRGEESPWFGKPYIGSSVLLGALNPQDLDLRQRDGARSLAEALAGVGIDVAKVREGTPLVDKRDIAAFLELHIEQGPVMVAREWPTAIVTGIRGNIRHQRIVCQGQAGHSGAVPRWLRKDAVFALAELISRLDEHWRVLLERGLDLVVTVGVVATNPEEHATTRIPGEVAFSFEIRSQSRETLEAFYVLFETECANISRERGVKFIFDRRQDAAPGRMDEGWVKRLLEASRRLGLPAETIASGAGHDAAVFANAGIPAAMVFVRNEHGSHNPDESMEIADFLAGVDLLYEALTKEP
ncbi:hydantoinase/carbamoylase family amidase [Chelatococcus composti]|uniref:N-carbamoyl-L-amino-acid hydrolase n=1 Tax=Chelatococcus composti TaxID=1743235 RepID=A0A841KGQ5_9HYPH|nr:hydantoinase/carbamoylase family amidase [Chelatococcus composti]MBB6168429.1 N-carbamoyl-L-amino-acid hydrolase [Chelatococcus composti]MBS7736491.1 hydantoinase/carbamoylase family amidase [Chelatococcus composti]GGG40020.1 Zn-dependent hydrolase [Chelatococcus composti]